MIKMEGRHLWLLVLILASAGYTTAQCPFTGWEAMELEGDDVSIDPLFVEEILGHGKGINVQIGHETISKVVRAEFVDADSNNPRIVLTPIQPAFADLLDYERVSEIRTGPAQEGLQIEMESGRYSCPLGLQIKDTNNRRPVLNLTRPLEFTVTKRWDMKLPMNFEFEDRFLLSDWDFTESSQEVVSPDGALEGKLRANGNEHRFEYYVVIFARKLESGIFTLFPFDGVNEGDPVSVVLNVEDVNDYHPQFMNAKYVVVLKEMPLNGTLATQVEAWDPDDVINGAVSSFAFQVEADYLEVVDGNVVFKREVPDLRGQVVDVEITAVQENGDKVTGNIEIWFPEPHVCKD